MDLLISSGINNPLRVVYLNRAGITAVDEKWVCEYNGDVTVDPLGYVTFPNLSKARADTNKMKNATRHNASKVAMWHP